MKRLGILTKPGKEGDYRTTFDGREMELGHSAFNLAWLSELIGEPKTVIDLGAFDGGDSLRFQLAFPDCTVLAVEADPQRFEIVKANLQGSAVKLTHSAACSKDGPIDWFSAVINGEENAQGSIYQHSDLYKKRFPFVDQTDAPGQVPGVRLDTLCASEGVVEIDLLHMDIEGAETVAMQGLGELRPKLIYLELRKGFFKQGPSIQETEDLLDQLGYEVAVDLRIDRLYVHRSLI